MAYTVNGTTITLTRGDTLIINITINNPDGTFYTPVTGDKIRFAMKSKYEDPIPLIKKDIPIDTLTLRLDPEDTKDLPFGIYVYDIQITKATGEVDTFITKSKFKLTEEIC